MTHLPRPRGSNGKSFTDTDTVTGATPMSAATVFFSSRANCFFSSKLYPGNDVIAMCIMLKPGY